MTSWNPVTIVRRAARNSPWIVMAVALHLILLAAATIFYTSHHAETAVDDSSWAWRPAAPAAVVDALPETPPIERKPPTDEKPLELSELPDNWTVSDAVPSPQQEIGDPNSLLDQPPGVDNASTAIGVGTKSQLGSGPKSKWVRGPDKTGGPGGPQGSNKQTETLVLDGMRWLARHQNEDGSWGTSSLASRCDANHSCIDTHKSWVSSYDQGLTGMAILCFLGAGYGHDSKAQFHDPARKDQVIVVGKVVTSGLKWLVAQQNSDGSFGKDRPFIYNQALATMALCEAYGLTQSRYWREPAQRAVDYLQGAQRPSPMGQGLWGWRYAARQDIERTHQGDSLDEAYKKELFDADTSVTGWAVMALKSARMSGLEVKQENLDGGLAFVKWASTADGQTGYLDPKTAGAKVQGPDDQFDYHAAGMSALSMCVRAFAAHDPDDPFLEPAAKRITADLPRVSKDGLSIDYYYWYYGSLALNQFDGPQSLRRGMKYWGPWNKAMVGALDESQQKSKSDCGFGGWLVPDRWCHSGGPVYATAINVLTLEVYYRYPNAFSADRAAKGQGKEAPQGVK